MNENVFDIKHKVSDKQVLRTAILNILIDNPDSVTEVASAVIGDEVLQLFTDQFNLHHRQKTHPGKMSKHRSGLTLLLHKRKVFRPDNFHGRSYKT